MISRVYSQSPNLSSSDSSITISGGDIIVNFNVISVSSNVNIANTDSILLVNTSSARTLTLPAPSTRVRVWIKDSTGQAQTNNITVNRNASEQIEGLATSKVLQTNWGVWFFVSNGTNWFVLG